MNLKEQVAVVQSYINHRTGKTVDINLQQFRDMKNVLLLQKAYNIAVNWFNQNNGQVSYI